MLRSARLSSRGVPTLHTDAVGHGPDDAPDDGPPGGPNDPPPDAFGPFRVLHQIGAGSLGPVYRAYQPELDRLVAVKMFRLDVPPDRLNAFVGEIDKLIAADLTHPGIAAPIGTGIVGAGMVGSAAYLAQDFVAADSLDVSLRNYGPVPMADAIRVAAQVAAALDFAAAVQVVHGALHLRDILVSADDTKLTGLGIVQALDAVEASSPLRPAYTSPERAAGDSWDRRADVFSLAAIVHELLWGRQVASSALETIEAITPIPGGDDDEVAIVFGRALADRPADRYETALAFADALQACFTTVAEPDVDGADDDPSRRLILDLDEAAATAEMLPGAVDRSRVMVPRDLPFLDPFLDSPGDPEGRPLRLSLDGHDSAPATSRPPAHDHDLAPQDALDLDLRGEDDLSYLELEAEPTTAPLASEPGHVPGHIVSHLHGDPGIAAAANPAAVALARGAVPEALSESFSAPPSVTPPSTAPPAGTGFVAGPAARFSEYAAERSRSAVWPLVLALVVGLAVGSAATFLLLNRDRAGSAGGTAGGVGAEATQAAAQETAVTAAGGTTVGGAAADVNPIATPTRSPEVSRPAAAAPAGRPDPRPLPPARAEASAPRSRSQAAAPEPGRLLVRSTPAGARVVVDGRNVGLTPITLTGLPPGSHAVRILRDGYAAVERRISLSGTRTSQSIAVNLSRAPGGEPRTAAAPAPVAPAPARMPTPVPAPVPTTPATLGRTVGALVVDSRPPAATVFVDGKLAGTTPLQLDNVDAGSHVVRIERAGYGAWSTSIRVTSGERTRVSASLER